MDLSNLFRDLARRAGLAIALSCSLFEGALASCPPVVTVRNCGMITCLQSPGQFTTSCQNRGGTISTDPSGNLQCAVPVTAALCSSAQSQQILGALARGVSELGSTAIEHRLISIRDRLQQPTPPAATAAGIAPGQGLGGPRVDSLAETPRMGATSAPTPTIPFAFWGQGFADYTKHDANVGFSNGYNSHGQGLIGGADLTSRRVFSANDALVLGLVGVLTDSRIRSLDGAHWMDGDQAGLSNVSIGRANPA